MKVEFSLSVEFYRQLALLLETGMPLPAGIESFARGLRQSDFRRALETLGTDTANGVALAAAMARFPRYFPEAYVRMVEAGEKSGTLPEVMAEIGQAAYLDRQLSGIFRDVMFYPGMVTFCAAALFTGLLAWVFAPMLNVFEELFGEREIFGGKSFLLAAVWVNEHVWWCFALLLAAFALFWWLLDDGLRSTRALLRVLRHLPGFRGVYRELLAARLCLYLGLLQRQKMPEKELWAVLPSLVGDPGLGAELTQVGAAIGAGASSQQAWAACRELPSPLLLAVFHVPGERLPDELSRLGRFFLRNGSAAAGRTAAAWEVGAMVVLAILCGTIIFMVFRLIISLVTVGDGPLA